MIERSKHSRELRNMRSRIWVAVVLATCISCDALAGIITDTSLGHASQTLSGNMTVTQQMGTLQGNNLFQSFQTFNINAGESVNFTTSTPGIANVISRVTGGSLSQINGQLSLTPCAVCGAPNFFFINPAGVTFGAGASVNVPGAFHVSTADYVKFPDGNFYADLSKASTFSVASPEAFGFLGATRASVTVNGGATLSAQPLQPISIVAGDIVVDNGTVLTQGGDIRVVAVGQGIQEIGFTGALPAASGNLSVLNGGAISADANGSISAGSVSVSAGNITIDQGSGNAAKVYTGISSDALSGTGNAGTVNVMAAGALTIVNGGQITSDTYSSGAAGSVIVNAGTINIDEQASLNFTGISSDALLGTGNAGTVTVMASGNLSIVNGGMIASDTYSSGAAGSVFVNAGSINIDEQNSLNFTGISSDALLGSANNAGSVSVTTPGNLSIVKGYISSSTFSSGNAGSVIVNAGSIDIVGPGSGYFTGIQSEAKPGSTGNAGPIEVMAAGNISISKWGVISSDTNSSGMAGSVKVSAQSIILNDSFISSDTYGAGNAGNVEVLASGSLAISNFGSVTSDTYDLGNAGFVKVSAGNITIDDYGQISSEAFLFSTGNAGRVEISTPGTLTLTRSGAISSIAWELGNAGSAMVSAGTLVIDGNSYISSDTYGPGNAGNVDVSVAGHLSITNGGAISSSTYGAGIAGAVTVGASMLLVDGAGSGISALADVLSSGQTGSIGVTATDNIVLSNGGQISIANGATVVAPSTLASTSISVISPRITILNSPNAITTSSTGNVAAGSININASDKLFLDPSGITTTSNLGNGGAISITTGILTLDNSQIATSVTGLTGNGGNIAINANTLILNTGFIQANTAAANATGGTVSIATQNLIPGGNILFLGGSAPYVYQPGVFGFNVIQAAAPTGVSGTVHTTSPTLDLSGSLSGLNVQVIDTGGLGRSPCQATGGSSMAQTGRGGLPPSARGLLRAEPNVLPTLNGHLSSTNRGDTLLALSAWGCS